MSRPTDTFRGARIAFDIADQNAAQPDLFADGITVEFWQSIRDAAWYQLQDCLALQHAMTGPSA